MCFRERASNLYEMLLETCWVVWQWTCVSSALQNVCVVATLWSHLFFFSSKISFNSVINCIKNSVWLWFWKIWKFFGFFSDKTLWQNSFVFVLFWEICFLHHRVWKPRTVALAVIFEIMRYLFCYLEMRTFSPLSFHLEKTEVRFLTITR